MQASEQAALFASSGTPRAAPSANSPCRRAQDRVLCGGTEPLLPLPMVNIISGGAHADGAIDIQDVLVVPVGVHSFAEAIEWAWRVRASTARLLALRGGSSTLAADEGGLAGAPGLQ